MAVERGDHEYSAYQWWLGLSSCIWSRLNRRAGKYLPFMHLKHGLSQMWINWTWHENLFVRRADVVYIPVSSTLVGASMIDRMLVVFSHRTGCIIWFQVTNQGMWFCLLASIWVPVMHFFCLANLTMLCYLIERARPNESLTKQIFLILSLRLNGRNQIWGCRIKTSIAVVSTDFKHVLQRRQR